MNRLRQGIRAGFERLEAMLGMAFPPAWNPLRHLGALGFFFYWIVAISGVYIYIVFDTGVADAYGSVEYLTAQWYLGGVMRSLHRYASDALVLMMLVHGVREFALDRYRGARWFTWVTGVPILWLVFVCGVSGYWLVWDKLAQYVAVVSTEWFDRLGIFGLPIARNFLTPESLDDRFFTLLVFIHIVGPLILLLVLWIHLQRVSRPEINPARGLAVGTFVAMLALSLVKPAVSQGPADLATAPAVVSLDWFYLGLYPLFETWPGALSWGMVGVLTLMMVALPWLPPFKRAPAAVVDLANCNGCTRCAEDCPYNAIGMMPRSDCASFAREAVVDPDLCVSCGICAGACPTSMPFRRKSELVPGIDLPGLTMATLRERVHAASQALSGGPRIMLFGCAHGVAVASLGSTSVATLSLPCIGQLPPAFVDYVLSRDLAEGVLLTGCAEDACLHRFGVAWTEARLAGTRDPHLRARVPRERLATCWASRNEATALERALADLTARLAALDPSAEVRTPARQPELSHG